jgi:hypothetical protein
MPRSTQEIIEHAAELARKFEEHEPAAKGERLSGEALIHLRRAALERAHAERHVVESVRLARKDGLPWSAIGATLGTSGEAARQRYGERIPH